MLLSSNFVLNYTTKSDQYEVYPFLHCFSNLKTEEQAFTKIKFPDVCPSKCTSVNHLDEVMKSDKEYEFSMVAGEFVEVYGKQEGRIYYIYIHFSEMGLRSDLFLP